MKRIIVTIVSALCFATLGFALDVTTPQNFKNDVNFEGPVAIDGTAVTATAAELNILDGVTADAATINAAVSSAILNNQNVRTNLIVGVNAIVSNSLTVVGGQTNAGALKVHGATSANTITASNTVTLSGPLYVTGVMTNPAFAAGKGTTQVWYSVAADTAGCFTNKAWVLGGVLTNWTQAP